jgi:hypothetical protein
VLWLEDEIFSDYYALIAMCQSLHLPNLESRKTMAQTPRANSRGFTEMSSGRPTAEDLEIMSCLGLARERSQVPITPKQNSGQQTSQSLFRGRMFCNLEHAINPKHFATLSTIQLVTALQRAIRGARRFHLVAWSGKCP